MYFYSLFIVYLFRGAIKTHKFNQFLTRNFLRAKCRNTSKAEFENILRHD